MRRSSRVLAALLTASLAAAPALVPLDAWARAGGGSSMGSRGARTYSAPPSTSTAPSGAMPMQRSATPQPAPGYNAPGYAQAASGMSRRGAFASGLLGGLIGAGIGGMLFGHGLLGGLDGFFSFIGLALQLLLLFFVGRWLFRRFAGGGRPALAGAGASVGSFMRQAQPAQAGTAMGGGLLGASQPGVAITKPDYEAFESSLKSVQAAWSAQDMNTLRRLATPEMVGYFGDQLSGYAARGARNTVTDVRLDRGDLAEAWAEGGREYATVAMRFSMVDVTRDTRGYVLEGDPNTRTQAVELWTFVRVPAGQWMLSAIQQGR